MQLSATSRGEGEVFGLSDEDRADKEVAKRIEAKKAISLHEIDDERTLADKIVELGQGQHTKDRAVLVFVRKVDDIEKIVKRLPKGSTQQLTGTLRGLERDRMADPRRGTGCPIFARFLRPPNTNADETERWTIEPKTGTVYLVCTSAGEVGVNISADHLVCDLSTFESIAQRFGRVNRFGDRNDTRIDIVYPARLPSEEAMSAERKKEKPKQNSFVFVDGARRRTLKLLQSLNGDGSSMALGELNPEDRLAAFAPTPTILSTSDILFDSWALTTIRGKLPGRPPVEPYLHGISGWEPPETHVAWREEVGVITGGLLDEYKREDLLEDYPLKPHELLRDNASRVFDRLKKLKSPAETPVWIVSDDESVKATTLGDLIDAGKDELNYKTVLLPPAAGGLENGMLNGDVPFDPQRDDYDVAGDWCDASGPRRVRQWDSDQTPDGMRLIRTVTLQPSGDDEDTEGRKWYWYERLNAGDGDGSKASKSPVTWQVHTDDVTTNAEQIVKNLPLSDDLKRAVVLSAKFHDLGKKRVLWQRSIGNPTPTNWLAKSGGKMKPRDLTDYRHEFGSLLDVQREDAFKALKDEPELQELVLHLIAVHHGFGRPHFPPDNAFDPEPKGMNVEEIAAEVPQRFVRLQRKYGRWGLAYLESLLRAADWAASAKPSAFMEDKQ